MVSPHMVTAATRFYLPSSGTPPAGVTPAFGGWGDTSVATLLPLNSAKAGTSMTDASFETITTQTVTFYVLQYISEQITGQTIAAQAVELQIRASEKA